MRFASLEIPAFGPFTDFQYSFGNLKPRARGKSSQNGPENDLHIFLGNNESGKSSLLRAISNLLYGIHRETPENFQHQYSKLELRAQLVHSMGDLLCIQRRKSTSAKQLTDAEGAPVSQMQLESFIGNLSKENFHALFGLGAEELQQGNEMLLSSGGALAEVVAAASSGSQHLSKAVASLYQQSEDIYKTRGKSKLQRLKAQIKELKAELKRAETRPQVWKSTNDKLRNIEVDYAEIAVEQEKIDQLLNRNSRLLQGLETVSRLQLLQRELDALRLPQGLVPGFASSLIAQLGQWQLAEKSTVAAQTRVSTLHQELQQLEVRHEILKMGAEIDQSGADLSLYKERREQHLHLQSELQSREVQLSTSARNINGQLTIENIDSIRLTSAQQLACLDAYTEYNRWLEEYRDSGRQIVDTKKQLNDLQDTELQKQQGASFTVGFAAESDANQLPHAGNSDAGLTAAIAFGQKHVDAAEELELYASKLESSASDIKLQVARLGLDGGVSGFSNGDIRTLALPQRNTLVEYQKKFDELAQRQAVRQAELSGLASEQNDTEEQIQRLHSHQDLPSRLVMEKARKRRNKFWKKIQACASGDGFNTEKAKQFSEALLSADQIADSLIDNAEVVAQTNQKNRHLQELQQRIEKIQKSLTDLQNQEKNLIDQWQKLWKGFKSAPETPASMLEWYNQWENACENLSNHEKMQEVMNSRVANVSDAMKRLASIPEVLKASGLHTKTELIGSKHLQLLLEAASAVKQVIDESKGAQKNIAQLLQKNESRLAELKHSSKVIKARLLSAGQTLTARFSDVGLAVSTGDLEIEPVDSPVNNKVQTSQIVKPDLDKPDLDKPDLDRQPLSPDSAYNLLLQRLEFITEYDQYMQDYKQLEVLQQLLSEYRAQVLKIAEQVNLEVKNVDTEVLCTQLVKSLTEQQRIQDKRQNLEETIRSEQESLQQSSQSVEHNLLQVAGELKLFNVDSPANLLSMQSKLERSDTLLTEISALKSTLASIATNNDLDAFIAEVREQDHDQLAANAEKLKSRREELRQSGSALVEEKTLLSEELKKIDVNYGDAADISQQLEHALAQQREATLEFIKTRLAADMLKRTLEEFRANNEGPLMQDASNIFKRLTCENFECISLAYTVDEKPYIQGERANGEKLTVEGMSDGTRDQLYLAMRLAALKIRLQTNEPMPLIVDDLLITFDDQRTEAALSVLADISQLTQVILFTHHRRVLDASNRLFGDNQVTVTELQNCA